jgi:hypothetical protein
VLTADPVLDAVVDFLAQPSAVTLPGAAVRAAVSTLRTGAAPPLWRMPLPGRARS